MNKVKEAIRNLVRQEIKSLNEGITERDMKKALNYINNDLFRIMNKFVGKVDTDAVFKSWMKDLHKKLKNAGVKI